MPSTFRIELDRLGYDWKHGTVVAQPHARYGTPEKPPRVLETNDLLLDEVFFSSRVGSQIPRLFASDKSYVYFPDSHPVHGTYVRRLPVRASEYIRNDEKRERIPHPDD